MSNHIILCNLPKVEEAKESTFLEVLKKIFTKLEITVEEDKITMPMVLNEKGVMES